MKTKQEREADAAFIAKIATLIILSGGKKPDKPETVQTPYGPGEVVAHAEVLPGVHIGLARVDCADCKERNKNEKSFSA